jgi:hypothetical protein
MTTVEVYLKNYIYCEPINILEELNDQIHETLATVIPNVLRRARENLIKRARLFLQIVALPNNDAKINRLVQSSFVFFLSELPPCLMCCSKPTCNSSFFAMSRMFLKVFSFISTMTSPARVAALIRCRCRVYAQESG